MEEIFDEFEGRSLLQEIRIEGLFNKFDYNILLKSQKDVTILYGLNGIGKTTILKIINCFQYFQFMEIFKIPFKTIKLIFILFQESNETIELCVSFSNLDERSIVFSRNSEFKQKFTDISETQSFCQFFASKIGSEHKTELQMELGVVDREKEAIISMTCLIISFSSHYIESLRNNINDFKILENYYLDKKKDSTKTTEDLDDFIKMLEEMYHFTPTIRIDLTRDLMDYFFDRKLEIISKKLKSLKSSVLDKGKKRIQLFEDTINTYLDFKRLKVEQEKGISIFLDDEKRTSISLSLLSSGEKNLLIMFYEIIFEAEDYSLVTIDEPEISLNINWQYDFIDTLIEIGKEKKIRYLIATHSPQIVNDYLQNCVDAEYMEKGSNNWRE